MKIDLTCDANWETRVDKVLNGFPYDGAESFFEQRNYGDSVKKIFVVLMCREPHLVFKKRIRFSKLEKILYMDVMLDYDQCVNSSLAEKQQIIAQKLLSEIPPIVAKYKFKDFDAKRFENDLRYWLKNIKWII